MLLRRLCQWRVVPTSHLPLILRLLSSFKLKISMVACRGFMSGQIVVVWFKLSPVDINTSIPMGLVSGGVACGVRCCGD